MLSREQYMRLGTIIMGIRFMSVVRASQESAKHHRMHHGVSSST